MKLSSSDNSLVHPIGYFPALDGLRALAVGLVICYHLGLNDFQGGYIGVDIFFVISGFIITSLLINQSGQSTSIGLRRFWGRRAKRLLPALFLMLVAVSICSLLLPVSINNKTLRSDALATLFYVANWHFIFSHFSYFSQFQLPSPLEHTWSLAIEEQFYIFWPLVLVLILTKLKYTQRLRRRVLVGLTSVMVVSSAAYMALSYWGPSSATSDYFSTFSRAFELLIGALGAYLMIWAPKILEKLRQIFVASGFLGLLWIAYVTYKAIGPPGWMFRFGFLLVSLAALLVVLNCARPKAAGGFSLFELPPINYLGRISYGLYLWHWPVIVFLTQASTGLSGAYLTLLRVVSTVSIASVSYYFVELPIRQAKWSRRAGLIVTPGSVITTGIVVVLCSSLAVSSASAQSIQTGHKSTANPIDFLGAKTTWVPTSGFRPQLKVDPQSPLRIMIVGDSVMWTDAPALQAALDSTGQAKVFNAAIPGWGLTTAKNWQIAVPKLLAQYRPTLVVGTWSWDNTLALSNPRAFSKLVEKFDEVVLNSATGVRNIAYFQFPDLGPLWSIAPDAKSQDVTRQEGVVRWNELIGAIAKKSNGKIVLLNVASSVEKDGKYTAWLTGPGNVQERVRMVDNTHFCPWGASLYSASIALGLHGLVGLGLPKGNWWQSGWIRDARYNTSPASCPNYHTFS